MSVPMLLLLSSLLLAAPEVLGARAAACVPSAASAGERWERSQETHAARHTDAAAARPEAPAAAPVSTFSLSPRLRPCVAYTPPALAPLAPKSAPSSQRDPPLSPA
jgi:hypothetical protein